MKPIHAGALSLLLAALGMTVGCGAAAERAPAAVPVVAEPPAEKAESESLVAPAAAPPPAPALATPATVAAPTVEARGGRGSEAGSARSELALAESQLQSSAGDCAMACRALSSMERATAHLCALATSSEDRNACQDARGKVLAGRDRVRASCGDCPGGPSLDKAAPIPSFR